MTRRVKVTSQEALAIIEGHQAFVKNIASSSPKKEADLGWDNFGHHWAFLIKQLQDPENFRPAKRIPEGANRKKIYDPLSQKWVRFKVRREGLQKSASVNQWVRQRVNAQKGMPKPGATHTKKTSVSLLPPNGRMTLFQQTNGVVLILDSTHCKIKERYIFDRNMITNDKPWYNSAPLHWQGSNSKMIDLARTTLDGIRVQQIEAMRRTDASDQRVLKWNECQVDLCTNAVIGIGIPQDDLTRRLNAQYRRLLLLKHLGRDVPLFILTSKNAISEYKVLSQHDDLLNPLSAIDREFVEAITTLRHELYFQCVENSELSVTQNIFELIERNKPEAVSALLQVFPRDIFLERDGKTPLQLALEKGHLDCLREIVAAGVNEKDIEPFGKSLLDAVIDKKTETALQLIALGAPLNCKPNDADFPYRAIHYVIKDKHYDLLLALLKRGEGAVANRVNGEEVGLTPLLWALEEKDIKAVQLLVEYGAVLDQSAVKALANAEKWDDLLAYCKVIFYDTQTVAQVFGWMFPIAYSSINLPDLLLQELIKLMTQLRFVREEKMGREAVAAEALHTNKTLSQEFDSQKNIIDMKNCCELYEAAVRGELTQAIDISFSGITLLERFERRVMQDPVVLQDYAEKAAACFAESTQQVIGDCVAKIKAQIAVLDAEISAQRFTFFGMNKSSMHDAKSQKRQVLVKAAELLGQMSSENNVEVLDELRNTVLKNKKWNSGMMGESRTGVLVRRAEKLMMRYAASHASNDLAMPLGDNALPGRSLVMG